MDRRKDGRVGDAVSSLKEGVGERDCGSMLVAMHCSPDKHEPSTLLNTEPRRRVVMLEEEVNRVHEVEGRACTIG
jgi:hypothetical protein